MDGLANISGALDCFEKREPMNKERLAENREQIKGSIPLQRAKLSEDDLGIIGGKPGKSAGCLQTPFEIARRKRLHRIDDWNRDGARTGVDAGTSTHPMMIGT